MNTDIKSNPNESKTLATLFVECVSYEMRVYAEARKHYKDELAKKGRYLKRGAFERINWNSTYIAAQYELCLEKKCTEPSEIRQLITVIGDAAATRCAMILEERAKKQKQANLENQSKK